MPIPKNRSKPLDEMDFSAADLERFWKKIQIGQPNECWSWTAARLRGYGQFRINGKLIIAHRIAWRLLKGEIPAGMCVCHTCDNPPCCNPNHLWLGTNADNVRDRNAKGRAAKGEQQGSSKLSESDVRQIRKLYESGGISYRAIVGLYKTSMTNVFLIVNRKTWKHIL